MDEYTWNTWNIKKIMAAINETSDNGLICFNMRYNGQDELERLNEHLFKKRPDLILRFSTENSNDLTLLPPLKNIRKLSLFNYESLNQIKNMRHLLFLEIYNTNGKVLDIGFFEELNNLIDLRLTAKVKNIEMLGKCESMESLYLSTTIENYNFTQTLNKLKIIYIDHCTASNDFTLLNKQMLEKISVTQINRLENVDTMKDFTALKNLRLSASKIKKLPAMNKMINLHELELDLMKTWENPEIIETIPSLEKLKLKEINTKLGAEQFYFLTEIETLKEIDFRFMDFNKKRIDKLNKWFKEKGKENIVKK